MSWITPVTDWESTDYLNFADFNRIENNINEVRLYLVAAGFTIPAITVVTNRTNVSIDYLTGINRIETNLEILRCNSFTPVGYLPAETWIVSSLFDYTDANRLEANALLFKNSLVYPANDLYPSETLYPGFYAGFLSPGEPLYPSNTLYPLS